ncbi:MAG: rod shape determining protein RodA [Gaiellaceae bacterium]|jgi:rod shape determining protein RodA|nr:rod shape determining protein RodA [Gaiellaceae bacterium]
MAGPVAEVAGMRRETVRTRDEQPLLLALLTRVDWLLLGGIGGLVGFGLWALAGFTRFDAGVSVTGAPKDPHYFVVHQGVFAAIGGLGFVVAVLLDPAIYLRFWRFLYGGMLVGLLVVLAASPVRNTHRWIPLGSFQLQPSEFGKPLIVLALAGYLAERGRRTREPVTALVALALALPAMLLVFVEPDLGTALVYAAALAAALYVAGTPWLQLAAGAAGAVVIAFLIIWGIPDLTGHEVLRPYQKARLVGYTHASSDPTGPNYNVFQSKTAVASGGVNGRGIQDATQTKFNFLPAHRTDFAFAAFAEQHGFVGASVLLLLYLLVLWRGIRVVTLAEDAFSAIVAGGIVCMLLFQIVINTGMTMGIAPVTGIPLPLVSYGGSSMIASLVALGLLLGIQVRSARRRW